ncbi:MAG: putative signal transducing protein [bacterium]
MSRRVRIGTCAGPADAALVRAMFSARGIPVVVGAEHHSSMLGGLGGGFLSLDIWVAEEDSEEATALLRDVREPVGELADDELALDGDAPAPDGDETSFSTSQADAAAALAPASSDDDAQDGFHLFIERRRRTGIALLLGCCITFGTAHMFTRAWLRGLALAGLELLGILKLAAGERVGTLAIVGAVAVDIIGAVWRVWTQDRPALPEARLRP